jgi:esterase/lipase superfamily enzyme
VRDVLGFGLVACALFMGLAYLYISVFQPPPYAGVKLQQGVVYISARRFETHGLEVLTEDADAITAKPIAEGLSATRLASNVTVLVHGYNAQEHKVATYFADLVDGLKSDNASIVVFDWPAAGVPFDELPASQRVQLDMRMMGQNRPSQASYELAMYSLDQGTAKGVAATAFLQLVGTLARSGAQRLNVIGHSMGCLVIAEAMRRQPELFSSISAMVWLAPDVDEAVLGEPWFRNAVQKLGRGLSVHFSRNDTILSRLSKVANLSSRLGATGGRSTHDPPPNVTLVDMTSALGTTRVHTGYLLHESESLRWIKTQFAAR